MTDSTFMDGYDQERDLGQFLSRPVRIFSTSWLEGAKLADTFRPWELFFSNPTIVEKLNYFGMLQCSLKLKLVINASPFYYGIGLMSYYPLPEFNPSGAAVVIGGDEQLTSYSQHPHIWFYPQNSQGGEMTLPFFYYKNWLDLTSKEDFAAMGVIRLDSVGSLRNANGVSSGDVSVQVYAWAEDVKLCGLTTSLALQSEERPISRSKKAPMKMKKKKKPKTSITATSNGAADEYGKGPVSKVASAVATAAGSLSSIPVIGPYMTATSFAASAVSSIASIFGYSNPPVICEVNPFKNVPFPVLASPDISTPVEKLTLDPKNELSIDSRTVGLDGTDELSIESLVTRESYIYSVPWTMVHSVDTKIFSCVVSPVLYTVNASTIWPTPMSHVSAMFKYWRGDIVFRFQIIASQYHRGRLRFCWEPFANLTSSGTSETTIYNQVCDITDNSDFEIRIPYMQREAWLLLDDMAVRSSSLFTSGSTVGHDPQNHNGTLSIFVLNELSAPVSSADVSIVVSVYGSDNLKFADPQTPSNSLHMRPDPDDFSIQSAETLVPSLTDSREVFDMAQVNDMVDASYLVYQGENVTSIRQLLRRSVLSRIFGSPNSSGDPYVTLSSLMSRYPLQGGYDTNGINQIDTAYSYNYAAHTPHTWISPCFIGQRGSMNWHFNVLGSSAAPRMSVIRAQHLNRTVGLYTSTKSITINPSPSEIAKSIFNETSISQNFEGLALTNQRTQTGLSIQAPMYSRYRMQSTSPIFTTLGSSVDESESDSLLFTVGVMPETTGGNINDYFVECYSSVGTDFNLYFFIHAPTLYYYTTPNPAV